MAQIRGHQIENGAITDARVASGAAISSAKLANWSGNRNAGGNRLTNMADGTANTDAVTKQQLDAAVIAAKSGFQFKDPARVASVANVAGTYSATGGSGGRGSFTGMPNNLDGVALANGDRVLLRLQTTGAQNGLYTVTTAGTGSNGVWERASDADANGELRDGTFVPVAEGTLADTLWVQTASLANVGGSSGSAQTWTKFEAGITYNADGTTLTLSAGTFAVAAGGIGTSQLGTDAVTSAKIADSNITTGKLADSSVATGKIGDSAVTSAKIADNNVTTAKINDGAVTSNKLASGAVRSGALSLISNTVTGTPNGTLPNFTLSAAVGFLIVFVNGAFQIPGVDYTVSGTTLTFAVPPLSGDVITVFGIAA